MAWGSVTISRTFSGELAYERIPRVCSGLDEVEARLEARTRALTGRLPRGKVEDMLTDPIVNATRAHLLGDGTSTTAELCPEARLVAPAEAEVNQEILKQCRQMSVFANKALTLCEGDSSLLAEHCKGLANAVIDGAASLTAKPSDVAVAAQAVIQINGDLLVSVSALMTIRDLEARVRATEAKLEGRPADAPVH